MDALDQLVDIELAYVEARTTALTDAEALRACGLASSTFYSWSKERRERLNGLAQQRKRDTVTQVLDILEKSATEAAQVKAKGLKSRKENIAQAAASDILDRVLGRPTQRQEHTGVGGGPIESRSESLVQFHVALSRAYGADEEGEPE